MMASFVLIILIIAAIATRSDFSNTHDAEIDRLLKKLNKPALKSIKSPDGDIIDCIHMKNHPIYDHPLFKNHTIQLRSSSFPKSRNNESSNTRKNSNMVTQLWRTNGRCPKNSIPIIRTRREDILRAKSIETYGKKNPNSFPQPKSANTPTTKNYTNEYSILVAAGRFHGAKATISLWKPYVQTPREFSLAQIWFFAGNISEINTIEAGWQVYKNFYGDYNPRFFVYWTADGYKDTGCYNLKCSGFVPINNDFAIGAAVSPISSIDGAQYDMPISIWKDIRSGNWWLKVNDHIFVGYWPSTLFKDLKSVATGVHWGGEIINYKGGQHTTTKMGSGRFAEEGYEKASYFRNIEIVDEGETMKPPVRPYPHMSAKNCYTIDGPGTDYRWGTFFYFGGPGRNPNCK